MIGNIQRVNGYYQNPNDNKKRKKEKEKTVNSNKKKLDSYLYYNLPVGHSTSIIDIRI